MIELTTLELRTQPSEFERDALSHYKGIVSSQLEQTLRGATMVFHNILPDLNSKGVKLRIVPKGTSLTDLPECIDLKVYKTMDGKNEYDECLGLWRRDEKLIVVKEEALEESSPNQKYPTIIHEFAHAIWGTILSSAERAYVNRLYEEEIESGDAVGDRLSNTREFFADSFMYYVTPRHRGSRVFNPIRDSPIIHPGKDDLARLNLKMFTFLHGKFGNIIDPTLVRGEQGEDFHYDTTSRLYVKITVFDPRKSTGVFHEGTIKLSLSEAGYKKK